jgi:hypothetical protein
MGERIRGGERKEGMKSQQNVFTFSPPPPTPIDSSIRYYPK